MSYMIKLEQDVGPHSGFRDLRLASNVLLRKREVSRKKAVKAPQNKLVHGSLCKAAYPLKPLKLMKDLFSTACLTCVWRRREGSAKGEASDGELAEVGNGDADDD